MNKPTLEQAKQAATKLSQDLDARSLYGMAERLEDAAESNSVDFIVTEIMDVFAITNEQAVKFLNAQI